MMVPAAGGPEVKIAETTAFLSTCDRNLVFSPDGKWLITPDLDASAPGRDVRPVVRLFLYSVENGSRRPLTLPPPGYYADTNPAFSPDGRSLAFLRGPELLSADLYVLPLDPSLSALGEPRRLTSWNRFTLNPAWTADGREIIVATGDVENTRLWRVPVSGSGEASVIASAGDGAMLPAFAPDGRLVYNPTEFIQASVDAVIETLFEALLLVVIVVIVFLQTWRAAIIPLLAIPVSLIGSFAVMAAVGISFNTLSLFGLVLAIGIVVDDAIVVVENVERYLTQGMSPKAAAHKTMDEVGGALIAISLVLIAVFLPTAFITGLQGTFYKQFAITIAASTAISAFVSLTLSPAMAALLLKTHAVSHVEKPKPTLLERLAWPLNWFFRQFNRGFEALSNFYGRATARLIRMATIVLVVYGGLLVLAGNRLVATPTGLIPQLDRSYLIAAMQLPQGATLERADKLVRQASEMIMATPGVSHAVAFVGFDGATFTNAPNTGVIFVTLKPFDERARRAQGQDPGGPARQDVLAARGLRVRARAALGARHRHRRRPQGLRPGSRRARPAGARGRHLGAGRRRRRRRPASPRPSRCSARKRRRSGPRSTAPRPSSWACRSAACSRRCRSTWARPTSTTSTSSAAPTR